MAVTPSTALALLNRALTVEIGIGIKVKGDRHQFRNLLYKTRKDSGDPRFAALILFAPNNDEVWICKKEVELPPI